MLIFLALALILIGAVLGGAGMRRLGAWTARATGRWRAGTGVTAILFLFAGLALAVRGAWVFGLPLAAAGVGLATVARRRPGTPGGEETMTAAEARSILGVGPEATRADIQAAYRRLMQRTHPDQGGSAGLAAQLNAARDRLIG